VGHTLAFWYDFLEVFAGTAVLSSCAARAGLRVGPPIELSRTRWFDLLDCRVVEWIVWMVAAGRVGIIWLAPPCTTFSMANWSFPRSHSCPRGFDPKESRTWVGNRLAELSLLILSVCERAGSAGVDENPGTSKMRKPPGAGESFGTTGFALLSSLAAPSERLSRRCLRFSM